MEVLCKHQRATLKGISCTGGVRVKQGGQTCQLHVDLLPSPNTLLVKVYLSHIVNRGSLIVSEANTQFFRTLARGVSSVQNAALLPNMSYFWFMVKRKPDKLTFPASNSQMKLLFSHQNYPVYEEIYQNLQNLNNCHILVRIREKALVLYMC